jgi:hypothetical protein
MNLLLESFTKPSRGCLLGSPCLVKDSRTTNLSPVFVVISDYCDKLKTTMRISNLIVGLAEYSAISMGVNIPSRVLILHSFLMKDITMSLCRKKNHVFFIC